MTKQLPGEFKNYIKAYFKFSDGQYTYFIRRFENRSIDSIIHKISAAPYRFLAHGSEFKDFAQKHENAQWLLSLPESAAIINDANSILSKDEFLSKQQIKNLFLKYPSLFDAKFDDDNADSLATRLKYNLYFYHNLLGLSHMEIKFLDEKIPGFLMKNVFADNDVSVINQIHYFCETFNVKLRDFGKMLCNDDKRAGLAKTIFNSDQSDNLMTRCENLLQIGLSAETIGHYPRILIINPLDVKLKYMTQRYAFGVQTRQPSYIPYPARLRYMGTQLDFSRAMYIRSFGNSALSKFYFATDEDFCKNAGITSEQLAEKYPLTKSTAQEFLKLYNHKNPCKLHFSEKELAHFDGENEAD